MSECQAVIQQGPNKGQLCKRQTSDKYCQKHIRHVFFEREQTEGIRFCDISRGCYVRLEDNQSLCTQCLHKARIHERNQNHKKRQDQTKCLDCRCTLTKEIQAKGKHGRALRRCTSCYTKLQQVEQNRPARERNFKSEGFKNKNVVWNHYVKGAKKRKMDFTLIKGQFETLIIQPCFYCRYHKDGEVNGIDRIDNNKGYIIDNVVACCEACNAMKSSQHPQEFIDKLYAIWHYTSCHVPIKEELVQKWNTTYLSKTLPTYKRYTKGATMRNIQWELTEEQFNTLILQPCYLCGLSTNDKNHNGIDRTDNTKGYTLDNSKPCCGHCNLMKGVIPYHRICVISECISQRYEYLSSYFSPLPISPRKSKIERRLKSDHPLIQTLEQLSYKPLNEVITQVDPLFDDIKEMNRPIHVNPPKQWKAHQIYKSIQENDENEYKTYCETHNDISNYPEWNTTWVEFVLAVKGKSWDKSKKYIQSFVENLRRIRHNILCASKNPNPIERNDRKHWPSVMVVRAFCGGQINTFKKFTEEHSNENPDDPQWIKRWNIFIQKLEEAKSTPNQMKEICSKFMTAERTKKYRASLSKTE